MSWARDRSGNLMYCGSDPIFTWARAKQNEGDVEESLSYIRVNEWINEETIMRISETTDVLAEIHDDSCSE